MATTFEDDLRAFLQHKYEQMPEVQEVLVQGKRPDDYPDTNLSAITYMIGVHNEALLRIAEEIDALRAERN